MIFIHTFQALFLYFALSLPTTATHVANDRNNTDYPAAAYSNSDPDRKQSLISFVRNENYLLPFDTSDRSRIALLRMEDFDFSPLSRSIRALHRVDEYPFGKEDGFVAAASLAKSLKKKYDKIIICFAGPKAPGAQPLSAPSLSLIRQLQDEMRSTVLAFGADKEVINEFQYASSIVASEHSDSSAQQKIGKLIFGMELRVSNKKEAKKLKNIFTYPVAKMPVVPPAEMGIDSSYFWKIDSLAQEGIIQKAYPGCTILAMKNGKIFYQKAFGTFGYDDPTRVDVNTIYDMASCTKICATTLATMKLYDEKKIDLNKTLGDYLPWLRNTDKAGITVKNMLLHQAGFIPDFVFMDFMMLNYQLPDPTIFHTVRDTLFDQRVAEDMYMDKHYRDSMNARIRDSKLGPREYVYSDIDLQLMAYIVEQVTHMPIDQYVKREFYDPMGLTSTGFNPRKRDALSRIAPTEDEQIFRLQHLHGDVHDPRAAMFNGVAGHAGLFSDLHDLAALMSMMLNGGKFAGKKYIKPSTIEYFTSYQSDISRRGIGFDKPSKERTSGVSSPYPSRYASPATFGHTGYTGTCIWADPEHDFAYIFLSNRVNPDGGTNLKMYQLEIRSQIQDLFYNSMGIGIPDR